MKIYALILSAAVLATACNSKPDAATTTITTPTTDTGMVMIQSELPTADTQQVSTTPAEKANTDKTTKSGSGSTSGTSTSSSNGNTNTGTASSGSSDASSGSTASTEKKGWSKTAKGAVIGGVTGAAAGAIINKKNRGAGAVIGGATGAAAGAIIGNEMDKKDGRH